MNNDVSFLKEVSSDLLSKYGNAISDFCIVIPSNRGALHFKQCLHSHIGKAFLSPDVFAIEEFTQKIAGLSLISQEELLIRFYKINQQQKIIYHQEFHEFVGDAKTILQDFNDIDLALAEAKNIFSDLSEIKELSYFGKSEEDLSDLQSNYLQFFKSIYTLYEELKKELLQNKIAYQGLLYRYVYENIENIAKHFTYKKIIFVGFNALQNAEIGIIRYFLNEDKADIYVDADEWYLNDLLQESGMFLRKMQSDFKLKELKIIGNYIQTINKKIQIIGFPQNDLQTLYIEKILQELAISENEKTALALADENLLLPLLYAIDTTKANITMGFSLHNTQIYKLLYSFFTTIENIQKYGNTIHYKDLYVFLSSPYIQNTMDLSKMNIDVFLLNFLERGKLFYTAEDLKAIGEILPLNLINIFVHLLEKDIDPENIITHLKNFLSFIKNDKLSVIDQQIIDLLLTNLEKLLPLFREIDTNIKSYRTLFDVYVSSLNLSFKSNPMSSLQIMGMLETRTLDFDNVIVLSVNENVLPVGKSIKSFIPYDVKTHYNIPTYTYREAVFSYHFYRLLQRAKNIYLLYDADTQNNKTEKSRFINQIQNEWTKIPGIDINETILSYPQIKLSKSQEITISKTPQIIERLNNIQVFSPSMLNRYLECSLNFYFHDVIQLSELETISEELQANVIGSVIHKILEEILKERKNIEQNIKNLNLEEKVLHAFLDKKLVNMELKKNDILYEKNRLIYSITVKYIENYLALLMEQIKNKEIIDFKDFEKRYEITYPILNQFINKDILLKGIIDRIDNRSDGVTTLVDYKTGRVEPKTLSIREMKDLFSGNNTMAFQLMFYAFLYNYSSKQSPLRAQIISFRKLKDNLSLHINQSDMLTQAVFDEFQTLLEKLIEQIYDDTISFTQTNEKERCKYCSYRVICRRD
ncbi:MAG: hypothetical protein GX292_01525 [Bacteroidales bacterium]|jgi:RecB family exonuclease|nr:hypothetical protein [Bacteroidales bacterium]